MPIEGMQDSWREFRGELAAFYEQVRTPLAEGIPLAANELDRLYPLIDGMLERSEALRREAEETLSGAAGAYYELTSEMLVAVSAVDALLASDLVVLDSETSLAVREIRSAEDFEPRPAAAQLQEGEELIAAVDRLFDELPDVLGAAPATPEVLAVVAEAQEAIAQLVTLAETPANALAKGFVAATALGAVPVAEVLSHLHLLSQVPEVAGGLRRRALAFVREHAAKLRQLVPLDWGFDTLAVQLNARLTTHGILARAANTPAADDMVLDWITKADPPPDQDRSDALRAGLTLLTHDYGKHTNWLSTSTKRLRFVAGAVSHVAVILLGPAGYCLMPAVFLVGEAYVAYSLADRLDARRLGPADRVEGVVRIVRRLV